MSSEAQKTEKEALRQKKDELLAEVARIKADLEAGMIKPSPPSNHKTIAPSSASPSKDSKLSTRQQAQVDKLQREKEEIAAQIATLRQRRMEVSRLESKQPQQEPEPPEELRVEKETATTILQSTQGHEDQPGTPSTVSLIPADKGDERPSLPESPSASDISPQPETEQRSRNSNTIEDGRDIGVLAGTLSMPFAGYLLVLLL